MKLRLKLGSDGLSGWVTNPDTGESYPCDAWEIEIKVDVPHPPFGFEAVTRQQQLLRLERGTVDLCVEIPDEFFEDRRRTAPAPGEDPRVLRGGGGWGTVPQLPAPGAAIEGQLADEPGGGGAVGGSDPPGGAGRAAAG